MYSFKHFFFCHLPTQDEWPCLPHLSTPQGWRGAGRVKGHSLARSSVILDSDCEVLVVCFGAPFTTPAVDSLSAQSPKSLGCTGLFSEVSRGGCFKGSELSPTLLPRCYGRRTWERERGPTLGPLGRSAPWVGRVHCLYKVLERDWIKRNLGPVPLWALTISWETTGQKEERGLLPEAPGATKSPQPEWQIRWTEAARPVLGSMPGLPRPRCTPGLCLPPFIQDSAPGTMTSIH